MLIWKVFTLISKTYLEKCPIQREMHIIYKITFQIHFTKFSPVLFLLSGTTCHSSPFFSFPLPVILLQSIYRDRIHPHKANSFQLFAVLLAVSATLAALFVVFSLLPFATSSVGHPLFLAFYAAFHRPLWATSLLSFLYLAHHGSFGRCFQVKFNFKIFKVFFIVLVSKNRQRKLLCCSSITF